MKTFELDKRQTKETAEFYAAHTPCGDAGAIGGKFSFEFTPNGLGTIAKVKCNLCGHERDLTDYESW